MIRDLEENEAKDFQNLAFRSHEFKEQGKFSFGKIRFLLHGINSWRNQHKLLFCLKKFSYLICSWIIFKNVYLLEEDNLDSVFTLFDDFFSQSQNRYFLFHFHSTEYCTVGTQIFGQLVESVSIYTTFFYICFQICRSNRKISNSNSFDRLISIESLTDRFCD